MGPLVDRAAAGGAVSRSERPWITGFALGINMNSGVTTWSSMGSGGGPVEPVQVPPARCSRRPKAISNCVARGYDIGITTAGNAQVTEAAPRPTTRRGGSFSALPLRLVRQRQWHLDRRFVDGRQLRRHGQHRRRHHCRLDTHMSGNTVSNNTGTGITAGASADFRQHSLEQHGHRHTGRLRFDRGELSVVSNGNNGIYATGRVLVKQSRPEQRERRNLLRPGKIEGNEVSDNLTAASRRASTATAASS